MAYTRPPHDAADADFSASSSYTRPPHDAADADFGGDITGATGAAILPSLQADSAADIVPPNYAVVVLPQLEGAASGAYVHDVSGESAVTLPALQANATGAIPTVAVGVASFAELLADATGKIVFTGTAAASLPSLSATADNGRSAVAAATLPLLEASGVGAWTENVFGPVSGVLPTLTAQFIAKFEDITRMQDDFVTAEVFAAQPRYKFGDRFSLISVAKPSLVVNALVQSQGQLNTTLNYITNAEATDSVTFDDAAAALFNQTLRVVMGLHASDQFDNLIGLQERIEETLLVDDQVGFLTKLLLASDLGLSDALARDPSVLCRMAETVHLADLPNLKREIVARLLDDLDLATAVLYIARLALGEDLTLADLIHADALAGDGVVRIARMAETITLISRNAATLELMASFAETLVLWTSFDNRYTLTAQSTLEAVDSFLARFLGVLTQLDALQLVDQLGRAMVFVAKSADGLEFVDSADQTLETLLLSQDTLAFVGRLPLEDEDYQAWVLNADSLGVTEYTQFPFNSLASLPRGDFGLTDTGLYQLTGDDDDGQPIPAALRTGDLDFGGLEHKRVVAAYLYLRGGDVYLKTISTHRGQRNEVWYLVNERPGAVDGQTRMVTLGKGVRGTTWAFELTNIDGGALDLRDFHVLPVKLTRRI